MDLSRLKAINQAKQAKTEQFVNQTKQDLANIQLQETIVKVMKSLVDYLEGRTSKTVVLNQIESVHTPDVAVVARAIESMHDTLKTHENTDITPIVDVMKDVLKQVSELPKESVKIPEQKDWSAQFKSLEKAIQAATKAIQAQETVVEAPVINVPETKVEVEAPNLNPISKELKAVEKAVKAIVIPEVSFDALIAEQKKTLKAINKLYKLMEELPMGGGGSGGGGMMTLQARDSNGIMRELTAIESSDTPGTYGLMSLNASGATASPGSLVTELYDYVGIATPTATTEVYTYKEGGLGGTTVATVTITYTDTSKNQVLTMERT